MAIFPSTAKKDAAPSFAADAPVKDDEQSAKPADFRPIQPPMNQPQTAPSSSTSASKKESVISADLNIEGKIHGAGHVRIAGQFKGDVDVQGDLTLENGAKLHGSVKAEKVTVAGHLQGNIDTAKRVDLLSGSTVEGDITADDLTIASGAKLRGHVQCGNWENASASRPASKPNKPANNGNNSNNGASSTDAASAD